MFGEAFQRSQVVHSEVRFAEDGRQVRADAGKRKIRVFIVSRFSLSGRGLQLLLEQDPGIEVLGCADRTPESLASVGAGRPDCVVVETTEGAEGDVDLLEALRTACPETRLVVITETPSEEGYRRISQVGIAGYLPDVIIPEHLGKALRAVCAGETVIHHELAHAWSGRAASAQRPSKNVPPLTPREISIIRGIADGLTDKQIGRRLSMAPSTVRIHISSVYQKLGLGHRAQVAAYAAANGLLDGSSHRRDQGRPPRTSGGKEPAGASFHR